MEITIIEKKILAAAGKVAARHYGVSVKAMREKSGVGENIPEEVKKARACFITIAYEAGARLVAASHFISYPFGNASNLKKWYIQRTIQAERSELINQLMSKL